MNQAFLRRRFISRPSKSDFVNGFTSKYFAEDPLFTVFSVWFDPNCPILNPANNHLKESAERFFRNLDDDVRADMVVDLRERISSLVNDHQYFLQTITGLNTFYSREVGGGEIDVTITTLESLDLRIAKIKELYNRVTYDYKNRRELLPDNLRWFDLKITVADGRKLAKWIGNDFVDVTPSLDVFCFTLSQTELVMTDGHAFLDTVSNSEFEMAENDLSFKGGVASMEEDRLALGRLLTNEKEFINTIHTQNKDSQKKIPDNFIKGDKTAPIEDKTLLGRITDRLDAEKKMLEGNVQKFQEKFSKEELKEQLLDRANNAALDIFNGVIRDVKQEIKDVVLNTVRATGATNASGQIVQAIDQADFYERLKETIRSNDLEFIPNIGLAEKILNGEKLSFQEKAVLFSELIKKSL